MGMLILACEAIGIDVEFRWKVQLGVWFLFVLVRGDVQNDGSTSEELEGSMYFGGYVPVCG